MSVLYTDVHVGDVLKIPGRYNEPDQYTVVKKYGNRIVLLSHIIPGYKVHRMNNQFDAAGYEPVNSDEVEPPVTSESEAYY